MSTNFFFATPIYTYRTDDVQFSLVQDEIALVLEDFPSLLQPPPREWDEDVLTSFTYDPTRDLRFLQKHVPILCNNIVMNAHQFIQDIGSPRSYTINIADAWINKYTNGQYMNVHDHREYDLSAVYYYQTNGEDGDIVFNNPCDVMTFTTLVGDNPLLHTVHCKPEPGLIVMFPSWLKHMVERNKTDHDRISLTFNIKLQT